MKFETLVCLYCILYIVLHVVWHLNGKCKQFSILNFVDEETSLQRKTKKRRKNCM